MNKEIITYMESKTIHMYPSRIYKILAPAGIKTWKEKSKRSTSPVRKGFNKVFYTEG